MAQKQNSVVKTVVDEITTLQAQYVKAFDDTFDIKALQGVERCIELKMKVYALDGKNPPQIDENPEITIDLSKLSSSTLKEIIELTQKISK